MNANTYEHTTESTWNAKLCPSASTFLCSSVSALLSLIKAGLHNITFSFLFYLAFLKTQDISLLQYEVRTTINRKITFSGGDNVMCSYWYLNEFVSFYQTKWNLIPQDSNLQTIPLVGKVITRCEIHLVGKF